MQPKKQGPSRQNHYVPEWYQRGFILEGSRLWLLDLSPPRRRPDGTHVSPKANPRPPKSAFWEQDLYVTRFGDHFNDEVETVLFQGIDDFGALAVRAFVGGDVREVHKQYQPMLSYLGAQKLRTPKGLDWIRSRYPALSQAELLREMQHLRLMFGALWAEAVHEVVSAEDSEVKFLVTDHPVTTFNPVLPDNARVMAYPDDAPIAWNGTQTLFPLDCNHLLILTHVAYAKDPNAVELAAKRTNARYFGDAMMRTDRLIRSRRFNSDEVIAVNSLLKRRARRYIASASSDWLHPELERPIDRTDMAALLRPPAKQLWQYGGEMYMGFTDGTHGYRDAFGRKSREHELVSKVRPTAPPSAEDECPCGSGRLYRHCCERVPPWDRPPWDVRSLHERNIAFLRAIYDVLDLTDNDSWERVRRTVSDDQVAELHRVSQWLWPENTDLTALLPRSGDGYVRAVYMGPSDPRTAAESFISLVPLFDQILVMDPFIAARNIRPEFSPVASPAQHKLQFVKNVWFWLSLEPLIVEGKVLVFPDPGDLNREFQRAMYDMATARTATWKPAQGDLDKFFELSGQDFKRTLLLLRDAALLAYFKAITPDEPAALLPSVVDYMRREAERDPLALLQTHGPGQLSQILTIRSLNLEVAVFIAQSTGAVPVTDVASLWDHLHEHTSAAQDATGEHSDAAPLRVQTTADALDALLVAGTSTAADARAALAAQLEAAQPRGSERGLSTEMLRQRLSLLTTDNTPIENPGARITLQLTPSMPPSGFASPTVQRLVVAFGRGEPPIFLGLALFRETATGAQE